MRLDTPITQDLVVDCIARRSEVGSIDTTEGPIDMPLGIYLINRVLVDPLVRRRLPVGRQHIIIYPDDVLENRVITDKLSAQFQTAWNAGLIEHGGLPEFGEDVFRTVHGLHRLSRLYLVGYTATISLSAMVDTRRMPEMQSVTPLDTTLHLTRGMRALETDIDRFHKDIIAALRSATTPNVITPLVLSQSVKSSQVVMSMWHGGTRTDISDTMLPVCLSAYIDGMGGICEWASDTRGARKASIYNKKIIPDVQYLNRRQQLRPSVLYIKPGDCGAEPFPMLMDETLCKPDIMLGTNMLVDGKYVEITREMLPAIKGERIMIRNPGNCRVKNGCCTVCGGRISRVVDPTMVLSLYAAQEIISKAAQLTMSTKHSFMTKTLLWSVPMEFRDVFTAYRNQIYVMRKAPRDMELRLPKAAFSRYPDLTYVQLDSNIAPREFSLITKCGLGTGGKATPMYDFVQDKVVPVLSHDLLSWLRRNMSAITLEDDGKVIVIKLAKFDRDKPIMQYTAMNDSVVLLIKTVTAALEGGHGKYTNFAEYLSAAAHSVLSRIPSSIVLLGTLLRSTLMTSDNNPNVPEYVDYTNIKPGPIRKTIRRTAAGSLGFQDLRATLVNPDTFIIPTEASPIYDPIFGV